MYIWRPTIWCSFHWVSLIVFPVIMCDYKKNIPCNTWTDICYASMHSFDHFHIIRQGLLLSIDTFGVSHILPILSLPFIAMVWYNTTSKDNKLKDVILNNITQVLNMATPFAINKNSMLWKRSDYTNSTNDTYNPLSECANWGQIQITEQLNKKICWGSLIHCTGMVYSCTHI